MQQGVTMTSKEEESLLLHTNRTLNLKPAPILAWATSLFFLFRSTQQPSVRSFLEEEEEEEPPGRGLLEWVVPP